MRQIQEPLLSQTHLLAGREWYHQRFDGVPMFIFAIADAEMLRERRKPAAAYPNARVCFFANGKADWHLDAIHLREAAAELVRIAERDPDISAKYLRAWQDDEQRFEDFFWREFPSVQPAALSDRELAALWKRYYDLVIRRLSSSGIIDHFALGTDFLIHERIRQETGETDVANVFAVATAPVHQSFLNQAELDLLRIAAGQSERTIQEHQQRYFWLANNYANSNVLGVAYFTRELEARRGHDPAAEIAKLEGAPAENRRRKDALFARCRFSPFLRTLLRISEDFTAWQDSRKRATMMNIYAGCTLLEEIGARKGYTLDELKHTTGFEIPDLMRGRGPSPAELRARIESSVFLTTPAGYYVSTDVAPVRALMNVFDGKGGEEPVRHVTGLTASLGRAQGRVKIVKSVDEISKVSKGDILVAVMTRPDYVPAMKSAAAIVTNEGGITSHAAIVSRELGIPCIIATKVATEVLSDGDLIDVNADRGTVTILEKAS